MASKILKKRSTTTAIPTSLEFGEGAVSNADGKLRIFEGNAAGMPVEVAGDNKMNIVATPTNNNILITDANGQAVDSGKVFSIDGTFAGNSDNNIPTEKATKTYVDNKVASAQLGVLNDRGGYDASSDTFPSTGGSGAGGSIVKGDLWFVSVVGMLGSQAVNIGDNFRALVDNPGQTEANWSIIEGNLGYTPENVANKINTITGTSTTLYTSEKAVKDYVDAQTTTAGTGTAKVGTAINLVFDNATIEVNGSNQAQVKDLGITNAKLAGSIDDEKLNQIVTANKVAGSSVQLATNGGVENNSGLQIKNDTTTGATVAQLSMTANGVGVSVDNSSIKHTAGVLSVELVDGGTF